MNIEISHVMPNGNIWLSIDGVNLIEVIECHNLYPAKDIADLIIKNLSNENRNTLR
jgi:hypothetical protein